MNHPAPSPLVPRWESIRHPVIGMLHLRPLPGSPGYSGDVESIRQGMLQDARALADGGVDGLMLENFSDVPFFPAQVPAYVVSHMTSLGRTLRDRFDLPLGINVLRNDALAALAVAHAIGAEFIRVNVLSGARVTDQGLVSGIAHNLLRQRKILDASDIKILADVDVKHSRPLGRVDLAEETKDLVQRAGADAVIVTGSATGQATRLDELQQVQNNCHGQPVFVGSGVDLTNIAQLKPACDGFIVGSSLKPPNDPAGRVDVQRVKALMAKLRSS